MRLLGTHMLSNLACILDTIAATRLYKIARFVRMARDLERADSTLLLFMTADRLMTEDGTGREPSVPKYSFGVELTHKLRLE